MADLERKSWTDAFLSAVRSKNFWIGATASMIGGFMGAGVLHLYKKYKPGVEPSGFRDDFMKQALFQTQGSVASGECSGSQFEDSDVCID